MTANEQEFARKIVRELNRTTLTVNGEAAARLLAAREKALDQYQHKPARGFAWVGQFVTQGAEGPAAGARYAVSLAVLVLGLAGIVYWQSGSGNSGELADVDARLLTDDLPIDAYLDKGFDSWLKRQSR